MLVMLTKRNLIHFLSSLGSVCLLGGGESLVEFCDGRLQEIHAEEAVVIEEVCHGPVEAVLPGSAALAVVKGQHARVHVVELFHAGGSFPLGVWVQTGGVFVLDDDKNSLLLVRSVDRQYHHQEEVGADTANQNLL